MAAVFTIQRPLATSSEMRPPENLPYLYDKTDLFYNSIEAVRKFYRMLASETIRVIID